MQASAHERRQYKPPNPLENVGIKEDLLIISAEDNASCETKDESAEDQCEETQIILQEHTTPEKE